MFSPDALSFSGSIQDAGSGVVYPEEVPDKLISDTEDVYFSDEEIYGTDEKTFEDYYITYFQIITGNQNEIDKLNTYYAQTFLSQRKPRKRYLALNFRKTR